MQNKSVLITRAKGENMVLRSKLQTYGYEVLECNLIKYTLLPINLYALRSFTNIIITSNFAAKKLPQAWQDSIFVWVVGQNSAETLTRKGYKIKFCTESALSLKQELTNSKQITQMIYLSSNKITVDMPHWVKRQIFYNVSYLESLTETQKMRYQKGIDYILLFSKNCAKTLRKLFIDHNLLHCVTNTTIIAISSNVTETLNSNFQKKIVLQNSNLMLEYLKNHAFQ